MLYEIKRVLTGKAIIALFALLIILPILFAVSSASSTGNPGYNINSIGYGNGSNGTYNVSVFLWNAQYGTPVQGTHVEISPPGSVTKGLTDANGFFNATFHNITASEAGNISYSFNYTQSGFGTTTFGSTVLMNQDPTDSYFTSNTFKEIVNNTIVEQTSYYSRITLSPISVSGHPNLNSIGVQFDPSGLKGVPPLFVYYKALPNLTRLSPPGVEIGFSQLVYSNLTPGNRTIQNSQFINSTYLSNESQLHYFAEIGGFPMMPLNTESLANSSSSRYLFEFFSPNGTEVAFDVVQLKTPVSSSTVTSMFLQDELPLLGIFVPLMAVFAGLSTFGKDKVDGALNYVVVRPISRARILGSRFFSNILAIFIPAAISLGFSSAVFHYYLGTYIPPGTIYLSLWSIAVMAAGFTGLVYLASSMMKSVSRLIGTSIGIFLLLDLFWSFPGFPIIPSIATFSTSTVGTLKYAIEYVVMDYITPSGFVNLVSYIGYGATSSPIYLGNYLPAQVGISLVAIIAVGILWIVVPFVLSLVRFSRFD